jgi:hypothetical protein
MGLRFKESEELEKWISPGSWKSSSTSKKQVPAKTADERKR